jgi:protein TonB
MENTLDTFFPFSRQEVPAAQNRQFIGAGVSFCVHAVAVCCILFLGPSLSDFKPPLVIDFSIEQSNEVAQVKKVVAQVEPEPVFPPPERKEVALPQAPLSEKVEVVETLKVVPLVTKKEVVKKIIPKPVVADKIETQVTEPEEIIPEQAVATENFVDDKLDKSPSAKVSTQATPQKAVESFSFKKKRYLKEHFQYIKENVQSKITYPRIARKMGWQGRVLISFVICKDGSVKDIRIVESSGFKALDNNAVKVIREVAPFPMPPVSAELIIPVIYKLS